LGKNSRNLLIPLWRRLSAALQNQPYQSAQPTLHLSYTASQSMDWETVCHAVENESHWHTDVALLLRHTRACEYLHQKPEALLSWFKLCWQFPEQSDIYESSNDNELRTTMGTLSGTGSGNARTGFSSVAVVNKTGLD